MKRQITHTEIDKSQSKKQNENNSRKNKKSEWQKVNRIFPHVDRTHLI